MTNGDRSSGDVSPAVVGDVFSADEWKDVSYTIADIDLHLEDHHFPPENFIFSDNINDVSLQTMEDITILSDTNFQLPPQQPLSVADFASRPLPPPQQQQTDLSPLPPFPPQISHPDSTGSPPNLAAHHISTTVLTSNHPTPPISIPATASVTEDVMNSRRSNQQNPAITPAGNTTAATAKRKGKQQVDDHREVRTAKKTATTLPQPFNPVLSPTMEQLAIKQQLEALQEAMPHWKENPDMPSDIVSTLKATVQYVRVLQMNLHYYKNQVAEKETLIADLKQTMPTTVGSSRQIRQPAIPNNRRMQTTALHPTIRVNPHLSTTAGNQPVSSNHQSYNQVQTSGLRSTVQPYMAPPGQYSNVQPRVQNQQFSFQRVGLAQQQMLNIVNRNQRSLDFQYGGVPRGHENQEARQPGRHSIGGNISNGGTDLFNNLQFNR